MHILPVFLVALLGGQQVLDDFRYADTAAARAVWKADESSPPVEVVREQDRPIMRLSAPFAAQPKLRRTVVDRRVRLDLRSSGGFVLEAAIDDPVLLGGLTLYFRSGSGWYTADKPAGKKGWRTLRFARTSFAVEGTPAGWDKIDGIRLSAWRPLGKDVGDTGVRLRRLAAVWHDVAPIVPVPTHSRTDAELAVAKEASHRLEVMLDELGLGSDPLDEEAIARGDLGRRRIVVLPSNFTPTDACIAALAKFVNSGGKLVIYAAANVPPQLRNALRLADDPNSAVQENDRGAIFDYDVPADTRECAKPTRRNRGTPGAATLEGDGRSRARLCRQGRALRDVRRGFRWYPFAEMGSLQAAPPCELEWKNAEELFAQEAYDWVIERAQAAHDSLVAAYLAAVESPPREGRGVWNHSGTGAFPDDPDVGSARPSCWPQNGFNMVLPNMLWGGLGPLPERRAARAAPRSANTATRSSNAAPRPRSTASRSTFGRSTSIWLTAPKDFVEKLRREGRTQVSVQGQAARLALPVAPGEPQARIGEHVGGRPQVSGRRAALRLHPLSRRRILLLRRLPAAIRGRQRPEGRRLAARSVSPATGRTSITIGAAGRSPIWWRP